MATLAEEEELIKMKRLIFQRNYDELMAHVPYQGTIKKLLQTMLRDESAARPDFIHLERMFRDMFIRTGFLTSEIVRQISYDNTDLEDSEDDLDFHLLSTPSHKH